MFISTVNKKKAEERNRVWRVAFWKGCSGKNSLLKESHEKHRGKLFKSEGSASSKTLRQATFLTEGSKCCLWAEQSGGRRNGWVQVGEYAKGGGSGEVEWG